MTGLGLDSPSLQKSRFQFVTTKSLISTSWWLEIRKVPGETVMAVPGWALALKRWLISLDRATHNICSRILASFGWDVGFSSKGESVRWGSWGKLTNDWPTSGVTLNEGRLLAKKKKKSIKKKIYFVICYLCVRACKSACIPHVCRSPQRLERGRHTQLVSHLMWVLGIKARLSTRTVSTLNG